ncbi:MAG: hypothetical protein QF890_07915 [Myxococcota bacterium]|jgi:spermidine synthase|nr:hypothetical protein [Myxococcota bacterium]
MSQPRWFFLGLGLALATASTLMLEIVLTRIFSIILWYHYGFLTVSLALLGLGLAGVGVYLYPEHFARERAAVASSQAALLFAVTMLGAILIIQWPIADLEHGPLDFWNRTLIFVVILVPFFCAGLCVAIPLSRYTERIGVLYSADLIGAGVGAVVVIPLIGFAGGQPSVIACAALALLSASCFAWSARAKWMSCLAGVGAIACLFAMQLAIDSNFFQMRYTKWNIPSRPAVIAERWNSFSRITVHSTRPEVFGWHLGKGAPSEGRGFRPIIIDGSALTPMIAFEGDLETVDFLRFDITALGYRLRSPKSALVIGSGGGRDILTAKLFGAERVQAIEVNPLIVNFVREKFRDFSGSPYDLPGVTWRVEDGRSFVARSRESFDLVQVSAVDTTAAMAAGALSLVENSLYTVEAFEDYYDRLTEDGIVSFTRNFSIKSHLQSLRLVDLVSEAWRNQGVEDPGRHIVIVAPAANGFQWGTLLASRRPFTPVELRRIRQLVRELDFHLLYAPDRQNNPMAFRRLLGPDRDEFLESYPYDVAATSDERPYFFFFLKPFASKDGLIRRNQLEFGVLKTPEILLQAFGLLAVLVLVLSFAVPVVLGRMRFGDARGGGRGLLYFAGIGLAFIMVELSLIQRSTLLLGQPVYALSGVLGCILVMSGLGSRLTHFFNDQRLARSTARVLVLLALGVGTYAILVPPLLRAAMSLEFSARVLVTFVTVAPLGFVMGMPLPLGMRLLARTNPQSLAWAWGVNGSLSVLGTVVAMTTSIFFGITTTLLVGALVYLLCTPVFSWRSNPNTSKSGSP